MNAASPEPPGHRVIEAFGGNPGNVAFLAGGQRGAWRAGEVVLKPTPVDSDVAWLGPLLADLPDGPGFRLARPIPASDGSWIKDGWEASSWVAGVPEQHQWRTVWDAADALHEALRRCVDGPPAAIARRTSPWAIGDRVAWGDMPGLGLDADASRIVSQARSFATVRWRDTESQLIHGDLSVGNVLFAESQGLAPAIIDFAPYWRPPGFATATTTADAVAWEQAPASLIGDFVDREPRGSDLLARAVIARVVAATELWRHEPARMANEARAYHRVLLALPSR